MKAWAITLFLAGMAGAWTPGWKGPFKVLSIESGFSTSTGHYTVQFYHDGWVSEGGCGSTVETKLFLPVGLTDFGMQQAKAWTAGLMTAFYKDANIKVHFTGVGCNASGIIIQN